MTVSTTGLRITHNGNGVTTEFAFPFRFLANGDLQVILIEADGTEVAQVINTNYTVAGVGVETGGTVTMLVAPATGEKLFIRRELELTQEIDYITGDRFPAETHETALDRLTMITQQMDEGIDRSLKITSIDADAGVASTLPSVSPGSALTWNSTGTGFTNLELNFGVLDQENTIVASTVALLRTFTGVDGGYAFVAGYHAPGDGGGGPLRVWKTGAVGFYVDNGGSIIVPTGGDGSGAWVWEYSGAVNVKWFGAKGDGVADDTETIQAAIDTVDLTGGGSIIFPLSHTFGISNTIFVKSNIRLIGDGMPTIKAISAFQGAMIQFGFTTAVITAADTDPCSDSSMENIDVDGNYLVTIKDWDPTTLLAAGLLSGLVYIWRNSPRNKVLGCKIHSAESDLLNAEDGADYLEVRNCEIYDATSTSAATQFINLMDIDGPTSAIIENNHCYDLKQSGYSPVTWGYALRLHATDSGVVQGNHFASGYHNILVDGRSNLIQGNRCNGSTQTGIVLFQNEFFCRYNVVIGNYVYAGNRGIREDDGGFTGRVELNIIAFNTVLNTGFPMDHRNRGTVIFGNRVYDAGGVAYPTLNVLELTDVETATSTLRSGTGEGSAVNNTSNCSSTAVPHIQFTRVGNLIHFSGTATTTITDIGSFEFRFAPPVSSAFTAAEDANGTAAAASSYASVFALASSSSVRVNGTAASAGAKTFRFTGSYIIK